MTLFYLVLALSVCPIYLPYFQNFEGVTNFEFVHDEVCEVKHSVKVVEVKSKQDLICNVVYSKISEDYLSKDGKILKDAEIRQLAVEISSAVIKWSTKHGLEPEVVLAIAYGESSFKKWLVCNNDVGLMQINTKFSAPHSAKMLEIKLEKDKLFDVDYNVMLFARYFVYLQKHLKFYDAVMAYNIGITRVLRINKSEVVGKKLSKRDTLIRKVGLKYLEKFKRNYAFFKDALNQNSVEFACSE